MTCDIVCRGHRRLALSSFLLPAGGGGGVPLAEVGSARFDPETPQQ